MTHWTRVKYGFIAGAIAVGIMMIADMLLSLGIGDIIFSPVFFIPIAILVYLLAPILERYIKYR